MHSTRVYISDMDPGFVGEVREALSPARWIEVVGSAGNGRRALEDLLRLRPDVLLTDLTLPGLDGIALLREISRLKLGVSVIVCTCFYSSASVELARRYGAAMFLCKPVELDNLSRLIQECRQCAPERLPSDATYDEASGEQLRRASAVRALLRELGLPSRLKGSACIVEAAVHHRDDGVLYKNLTRGLYCELARNLNSTVPRIERSLRSAIAIGYERGNLSEYFSKKPTNKQFIDFVLKRIG